MDNVQEEDKRNMGRAAIDQPGRERHELRSRRWNRPETWPEQAPGRRQAEWYKSVSKEAKAKADSKTSARQQQGPTQAILSTCSSVARPDVYSRQRTSGVDLPWQLSVQLSRVGCGAPARRLKICSGDDRHPHYYCHLNGRPHSLLPRLTLTLKPLTRQCIHGDACPCKREMGTI